MEFQILNLKSNFIEEILNELQRSEAFLWKKLDKNDKLEILYKLEYMQNLILKALKILNNVEIEINLFKIEKTKSGNLIQENLEELYLNIEKQKKELSNIEKLSKNEIIRILDGEKYNINEFSENSQKIKLILTNLS